MLGQVVMQKNHCAKLAFCVAILLTASLCFSELSIAQTSPLQRNAPVFRQTQNTDPITPEQYRKNLAQANSGTLQRGVLSAVSSRLTLGQGDPQIVELARGLQHDPDLIYEFVHDNIAFETSFGSAKGAIGTLLDRSGNAFDQASLMIALLRESGLTANYVNGTIDLDLADLQGWIGPADSLNNAANVIAQAGIPVGIGPTFVRITHVWVRVTIDGTGYVFNPSFKTGSPSQGIDLASAMGYAQATFLTDALAGATQDPDFLQNVNRTNIRGALDGYATNLVDHIRSQLPGARLADVIGGIAIAPLAYGTQLRQTVLPNQATEDAVWLAIPDGQRATLRIKITGFDQTLFTDEIYHKRLTIAYNSSVSPVLRLEGTTLATGFADVPGTNRLLELTANVAFTGNNGTFGDGFFDPRIRAVSGATYAIMNGWGHTGRGLVQFHKNRLQENRDAGQADNAESVLGESLAVVAKTWLAQRSLQLRLAGQLSKVNQVTSFTLGVAGDSGQGPYVDIGSSSSLGSFIGSQSDAIAMFFGAGGGASALESAVVEQVFQVDAASTMVLLDLAVTEAQKIYEVTASNVAQVSPLLLGYNAATLNEIVAQANSGQRVIAPERGDLLIGQWRGVGYLGILGFEAGSLSGAVRYAISGGLNGGFATEPLSVAEVARRAAVAGDMDIPRPNATDLSSDPVDLFTGHFVYDNDDLTVGSAPQPIGLGFQRSYNSGQRLVNGPLGRGWTHNFAVSARQDSDGFQALGEDSPIDAAGTIAAFFVAFDLLVGDKTINRLVITSLVQKWAMDQMVDNVVTIRQGNSTTQFVRLPGGSYNSSPGSATELTRPAGAFAMRGKDGTTLDFAADGKIQTWRNANGVTLTFNYTGDDLTSVSNGLDRTLTLAYSGTRVASVSDGTGRSVSFGYDVDNNLTRFTDPGSNDTIFTYDLPGRMTQITLPSNPTVPFVSNNYDSLGRVKSQVSARGHLQGADPADFMTEFFVAGTRTAESNPLRDNDVRYFSSRGKRLRRVDRAGHITDHDYDGEDRVILTTFPEGNYQTAIYNADHFPVTITRHPKPGSVEAPLVEQLVYESNFGKVTSITDPLGRRTDFVIDPANGNLLRIDRPPVGGMVASIVMTYNTLGQVETVIDPEGAVTRIVYAPNGNLTSTIADDGGLSLTTNFGYNAVGDLTSVTDPRGNQTTLQYDARRLLTVAVAPAPFNFQTIQVYDNDGRLLETQRETGDLATPMQIFQQSYDVAGNRVTATDPLGAVTTFLYDDLDRVESILDGELRERVFSYDLVGRLLRTFDVVGGFDLFQTSENSYTSNGLPASLMDGNGNLTTFDYDGFDRQMRITFPDGSFESATYDVLGNVLSGRTRAGDLITFEYDALDRLIRKSVPDLAGPLVITYDYDMADRLLQVSDGLLTVDRTYDALGRLNGETQSGRAVGFDYDGVGNVTKITWPDLYATEYGYDTLDRLVDVSERPIPLATPSPLANFSYDALSRRTRADYGNGTATTLGYNLNDNLESLVHSRPTGGSDSFTYLYNGVGEPISQDISNPANLYRPTVASRSENTVNGLNQYTSSAAFILSYDGNGSLTEDGSNHYSYDAQSRLVEVLTATSLTVTMAYDPLNRRVEKGIGGQIIQFLHSGLQEIAEYDANGNLLRRFVPGADLIEVVATVEATGARIFHHTDALGSTVARSNAAGSVSERHAYGPFGEESGPASGTSFRFAGQRYDAETGLYYLRARYYSIALGRFLQPDPAGFVDGPNLYIYANNSPLAFSDPLGLRAAASANNRNLLVRTVNFLLPGFLGDVRAFVRNPGREVLAMLNSAPPTLGFAAQAPALFGAAVQQLRVGVQELRLAGATTSTNRSVVQGGQGIVSNLPVPFDGQFATRQVLGTTTTPGGRQINLHAAQRMVNPPSGRSTVTPSQVDQILDGATNVRKRTPHPEGNTLTIQNRNMPGNPQVIVDEETGSRVITVISP